MPTRTRSKRSSHSSWLAGGIATIQETYRNDPVGFNTDILERLPYDPDPNTRQYQHEICQSVVDYRVTVVYSGNSVGKDYLLGGLIPWWSFTRVNSLTMVTGVSQTLLGSVTFKEVRRAVEGSPLLMGMGARMSTGIKTSPQTLVFAPGWHVLGYSTTNVERASGQHSPDLFAVINEGSGVEDHIYDAVDSWAYRRLLVTGNPLRADGRMVELIRQADADRRDGMPKHLAVNAIRVPSTDSPHARLDRSPFGLADATWLRSTIRHYGPDSAWVKSHIHAEVPVVSADALIPRAHLDWAASRPARPGLPPNHPLHRTRRISCDLGEGVGRDASCVLVRDDWGILEVHHGSALGLPEAAERIWRMKVKWDVPDERISFDKLGIGRGFPPHLKRYGIVHAVPYAGEASPKEPASFTNLRSEAAWKLKLRLDPTHVPSYDRPHLPQPDFHLSPDGQPQEWWPRLREELEALTYECVGKRVKLLPKADWCVMLGHSPDLADALIQSFGY